MGLCVYNSTSDYFFALKRGLANIDHVRPTDESRTRSLSFLPPAGFTGHDDDGPPA
ncbi:hypothetical protein AG1IA_06782 [Rhizoctonia solani AG-1 IA]|uniref:Uncharacterized protein n=1 Tax=Thanatephorus cucumeris (strain AG1-IA) TaxID=983506 RepID=L8WLY5_THACA|nr:hypothetical protein AG1IA_06782 [Rhizoctonia solani AG-1 IA]